MMNVQIMTGVLTNKSIKSDYATSGIGALKKVTERVKLV